MAPAEPPSAPATAQGAAVAIRDGDRTVVWLRGEHDLSTTDELSETLARAIAIHDTDLVVDLSHVQFMDASTIGVIVRARALLLARSRALSLRAPTTCARRVLDACGLAEIDPGLPGSEDAGALGSWVAVPVIERADQRADGSVETATATPGECERTGAGASVPADRRGP